MARSPRASRPQRAAADTASAPATKGYRHKGEAAARPEAGAAPRFKATKASATYRYDNSLSPALDWDQQPAREVAAWLLAQIEAAAALPGQTFPERQVLTGADGKPLVTVAGLQDALAQLKAMQKPFLNWAGKAERLSFDVPTLPLFIHERLSTEAIIKTLEGHRKAPTQSDLLSLFADEQMPMAKQVDAYAYRNGWVNRMVLGDSLAVMNSLLRYEGLGGQVQMIYMDPPYGVKFGSNFQPFVRKRGSPSDNDDPHLSREPEIVQAYRDTWQFGLHSYLTYLRDRIFVAKDLLAPSGSIFVQIGDDNLHLVRSVMDEVFGQDNFCALISFKTTGGQSSALISSSYDHLVWYARDREQAKARFSTPTIPKVGGADDGSGQYVFVEPVDESADPRPLSDEELEAGGVPAGMRLLAHDTLYSQGGPSDPEERFFTWRGRRFECPANTHWKPGVKSGGMQRLADANRLMLIGNTLRYKRYVEDNPVYEVDNVWDDTVISGFGRKKQYVVETSTKVVERCLLMTTRPGDIVLDPTLGSGTTPYTAEKWGRRWIAIDTSRVPLAIARERLLTATFPWFVLLDAQRGPVGGFAYSRKQNKHGQEVGGIVPYVTLGSIANNEPPGERVVVDRPDVDKSVTRVTGPFVVEAVLPTPQPLEGDSVDAPQDAPSDHIARMIEVLRRSPSLRLPGGGSVTLKNIRRPGKSLNLSAEAVVDHPASGSALSFLRAAERGQDPAEAGSAPQPVAILFGPPNGAVTAKAVLDAAKEANVKGYAHLYVIGFLFTAEARAEIMAGEPVLGLPASPVEMTHDVMMGDLLKTQRSSQIFAITGSPEIAVTRLKEDAADGTPRWQVRLMGLDTFDPAAIKPHHLNGDDVPMWMLDTGWNGMAFCAHQVFFPRTKAWESLRKVLNATHDASVWEHLAGDLSAPFAAPIDTEIAVKVLDDRGNELLKVHRLGGESA
jgi:adenine-specific DNA-methyltransferase